MDFTQLLGYAAAALVLLTFSMKTMVPLRIAGILSNIIFIAYGYLSGALPILILHLILLPLNAIRLRQILELIRNVEAASKSHEEPNMEWLNSIAKHRHPATGEMIFSKGDVADCMYFILSGNFRVREIGVDLKPGQMFGEIGLLAKDMRRTQSIECTHGGELLEISYDRVKQLYFQSPKFGFYFLQLASRRLMDNLNRQEKEIADLSAQVIRLSDPKSDIR